MRLKLNLGERVKIRIHGVHLGYIDEGFLTEFKQTCRVRNMTGWIKKTAHLNLGLYLDSKESVLMLLEYLDSRHYQNGAEWVRECMRQTMYRPPFGLDETKPFQD